VRMNPVQSRQKSPATEDPAEPPGNQEKGVKASQALRMTIPWEDILNSRSLASQYPPPSSFFFS
jgi:hypothetical protein